ncbi:hypothetical protein EON83_26795 [bacterium]|nr:MAG: hypothetical protein EON83_26795 [bacterium]
MQKEPHLPPIASPYGAGIIPTELTDGIEIIIQVDLSFESALRSALVYYLLPSNLGFAFIVCITITVISQINNLLVFRLLSPLLSPLALLISCFAACSFVSIAASTFRQLVFDRRFEVEVEKTGIHINYLDSNLNYSDHEFLLPWNRIAWVLHVDGNVCLIAHPVGSLPICYLLPRESFGSSTQSQTFATSLHQLRRASIQSNA